MSSRLNQAFKVVKRQDFVPKDEQDRAALDIPLPIGYGQTISQPTTVRLMLSWLNPLPGHKVLDVGSGSGWSTALLAYVVGTSGFVYAVERIPELLELGRLNCQKYKLNNVAFHLAGGTYGLPAEAPFDRILVSAAARNLPQELPAQLSPDGRMVIPVNNDIYVISKDASHQFRIEVHRGFLFVPLV